MNTLKKIVVAYDSSAHSKKAVDWALHMAQLAHATIDIVTVLVPSKINTHSAGAYASPEARKTAEEEIELSLLEIQRICEEKEISVKTQALFGNAVKEILFYADSCQADMIICGTRGLGSFTGLLLGSVAHTLVTYSKIPVLVIK